MKFTIQREALLKPLQSVIGVVERRQTLPVLSNLLLKVAKNRINITASDLEVELSATVEQTADQEGATTVPARKLFDICRTLPEHAELRVGLQENKLKIVAGRSRFTLATLPATEFPTLEQIQYQHEFRLSQGVLKALIEQVQFSMAQQDVRYYLNGLMLESKDHRLRAVATDGHRLAFCEVHPGGELNAFDQVIIPRKGIQEIARLLEDVEELALVQIGGNHVRIELPHLRFTSKLIDGKFPDYERVIPQAPANKLIADRETLKQALVRTSILSNEKYRGVRLTLAPDSLSIQANNPEQEQAEEELSVQYKGSEMEIGFNVSYLLDAINAVSSSDVELSLSDANSSCLIKHPDDASSQYVIMPMRL